MKEFWLVHKKKIIGVLTLIATSAILIVADTYCNRLPPPFNRVCVEVVKVAVAAGTPEQDDGGLPPPPARDVSPLELCPGGADGPLCLSNGYALPMEDGGRCRCK